MELSQKPHGNLRGPCQCNCYEQLYLWDCKNTLFVWRDMFLIKWCRQEFIKMPSFIALLPLSHCRNLRVWSPRAWVISTALLKPCSLLFLLYLLEFSITLNSRCAWMQVDWVFTFNRSCLFFNKEHLNLSVHKRSKTVKWPEFSDGTGEVLGRSVGRFFCVRVSIWCKKIQ